MILKKFIYPRLILNKSIAIVLSSEILLDNKNGYIIDQFSEIIRFNRAPVSGYEKYVGKKTTLRVLNYHTFTNKEFPGYNKNFIPSLKNQRILVTGTNNIEIESSEFKGNAFKDNEYFYSNTKRFKNIYPFFLYKKIIFEKIYEYSLKYEYSVGFFFINLCIANGIKPKIFGFEENINKRSHYYNAEMKNIKQGKYHNLQIEHELIVDYEKNGFLTIEI